MSRKLLVGGFKWVENTSQFIKDFIENYNEGSDEGYFPGVDVQYPEKLYDLRNYLPFLLEGRKIEENLQPTCIINQLNFVPVQSGRVFSEEGLCSIFYKFFII